MSILLIRHGETALNAARVLQPADTPLSERGLAQAEALAARLAELGVAAIWSSDLPRALRTAQAIAAATGAPLTTTGLLHERNFGDLRGLPYDSLAVDPITSDAAPPGGESTVQFEARVAEACLQLVDLSAATAGHLAVVTHGLVIRTVLSRHTRLTAGQTVPLHLGNTSVSRLEVDLGRFPPFHATLLNCTLHLKRSTGDDAHALSGG